MIRCFLLLAALAIPACGGARPPSAMVSDPCAGLAIPVPDAVKAYFRILAELPQTETLPAPPPELAVYRQANAEARKSDWADLCRYHADNARLREGAASARRVVFIGDSITELWTLGDPALFSGGIVGRGISGQTSPQMLLRFQADVVALQPEAVHILAGTNDIAGNTGPNSADQYRDNIRAMVTLARSNGIRVILGAIPPAGRFPWKPALKPALQVVELNRWLENYAASEGLAFADYHAALADRDGAMNPAFAFDGIHPNREGYRVMARLLREHLRRGGGTAPRKAAH